MCFLKNNYLFAVVEEHLSECLLFVCIRIVVACSIPRKCEIVLNVKGGEMPKKMSPGTRFYVNKCKIIEITSWAISTLCLLHQVMLGENVTLCMYRNDCLWPLNGY